MSARAGTLGGAALIWCPFGSAAEARAIAEQLVAERLVACANILPPMLSIFDWQGRTESAEEVAVFFKTDARLLDTATQRLAELHSYDTPAISGWRADSAPAATCDWLAALVTERES